MPLAPSCPRCTSPVTGEGADFACATHGPTPPLWRPDRADRADRADQADYACFAELVELIDDMPTYLPWPMSPGWTISDFGCVGGGDRIRATVTTTVGTSDLDGAVSVTVVSEEPGVGLGARASGTVHVDPGPQLSQGPPAVHVRAGGRTVPLWLVDGDDASSEPLAQAVFAGEAEGRWLWLVVRPASAALLLHDEWLLADVTGFGPEAVELPFGGPRPTW